MEIVIILIMLNMFSMEVNAESKANYIVGSIPMKVPLTELVDISPWLWLKSFSGLDANVDGFIFELDPKCIDGETLKYPQLKIVGSVSDFSNENLIKFSDSSDYETLWYAQLDFEDREIIKYEELEIYFVYASKGYRGMFYIFSSFPDKEKKLPHNKWDFLVAICSSSSVSEHKNVSCNRQILVQDKLLVNYSFSLENLPFQQKLDSYIRNKVISWIVN
ncbi:hypothetical protein [Shewanella marina]|uniref:hypothetical protein n=1 Tax=Shewanella marina TaxID=487319 RepID=UPI000472CA46|nr:hypothetical protein [Shewanella marina]